ncbi:MAG: DUF2612 domain-containing protein [Desulfobacterales bacterium]|nr:DUF2612 domain-containing protein [Desulfobacterales bacterium]
MTDFKQSYIDLLIKQYWQQDNAPAEIRLQAGTWEKSVDWLRSFLTEFDLDNATGDRLDIIGRIIGLKRLVPFIVPKIAFGFDENPNARGFDDKFLTLADRAPFADKFERQYTSLQLDDTVFRFFIRAKISKNSGSPYLVDDEGLAIQRVVNVLFGGSAYALDNQDMTLSLYVSPAYNLDNLRAIIRLDLLPKPHGVDWEHIIQAGPGETFGFADNPDSLPFADKFDLANQPGGRFAEKIIIDA